MNLLYETPAEAVSPVCSRIRRRDGAVPTDAVEELHVEEVEVDRVGIHAVVGEFPDLGAVIR